jgi:hypothetical protein
MADLVCLDSGSLRAMPAEKHKSSPSGLDCRSDYDVSPEPVLTRKILDSYITLREYESFVG